MEKVLQQYVQHYVRILFKPRQGKAMTHAEKMGVAYYKAASQFRQCALAHALTATPQPTLTSTIVCMMIGVPRESFPGERRVALVPAVIPSLTKAGFQVVVEAGAGLATGYLDTEYAAKAAQLAAARAEVFRLADVVVQVLCHGSNDRTGQ